MLIDESSILNLFPIGSTVSHFVISIYIHTVKDFGRHLTLMPTAKLVIAETTGSEPGYLSAEHTYNKATLALTEPLQSLTMRYKIALEIKEKNSLAWVYAIYIYT